MINTIDMFHIRDNENVYSFIYGKYGRFDEDSLREFIKNDYTAGRKKITDEDADLIIAEINKLLDFQKLTYKDLIYLGRGQSFSVLQVGDAIVKVGHRLDISYEEYKLVPIREVYLQGSKACLYVSQRANGRKANHQDVLQFYKKRKEENSLWLDPKENNLGYVDRPLNFQKLYGIEYSVDVGGPYLMDYEDVITPENFDEDTLLFEYGSEDDQKYLMDSSGINMFLYNLFVKKRNNLLQIEKEIAIQDGNFDWAYNCEVQQTKNSEGRTDYYASDYYYGDDIKYPKSGELLRKEFKYKVINAFKPKSKKEDTKKHR